MRQFIAVIVLASMWQVACAQSTSLSTANSTPSSAPASQFITLGTNAGPLAEANRSQPANALQIGDELYLVDTGDGTAGQLAKAGLLLQDVDAVLLSHNHFDHTGGLMAILGLRMQLNVRETLPIYGPPGTQTLVDGLLAGMAPMMQAAYGMPGQSWSTQVKVTELVDGASFKLGSASVTVAENTHFKIPQDSGASEKAKSLSYRFDLPDRSIVYTGDTGPSKAVEDLARGADVLVSEMMDIDAVLARIRTVSPNLPPRQFKGIEWHLRAHHVLPSQVGEMASKAGVKTVVVTHMAPNINTTQMAEAYIEQIRAAFDGDIVIAEDLQRH